MKYVALLRGINVGGNNIINMKELKATFESVGMKEVITYINSGNIIFSHSGYTHEEITELLEKTILDVFNLSIKVLLRSYEEIEQVMEALPQNWTNNKEMKSNVMFLWQEIDSPLIMEKLTLKPNIDTAFYIPGTILWSIPAKKTSQSGLMKLAASKNYKQMTVRNVNTVRKIFDIMKS
jgi:uncharacterized protein (DUF1697 family)